MKANIEKYRIFLMHYEIIVHHDCSLVAKLLRHISTKRISFLFNNTKFS